MYSTTYSNIYSNMLQHYNATTQSSPILNKESMTIWFTFICLMISQIMLMLQKKSIVNKSQKARFTELEEEFFTAMKDQEDALEKSFKRLQDKVETRLDEFFAEQKVQDEKMNTLITDLAVTLTLYGLPKVGNTSLFPTDEKANERKVRLESLVNKHITSTITDRVYMGVY